MKINYHHNYLSGNYYHVYNHSSSNKNIFIDRYDFEDFLAKHQKYFDSIFDTIAYCLMPNHYHLLVRVKDNEIILNEVQKEVDSKLKEQIIKDEVSLNDLIEDQYRRMFSSYVMRYNNKYSTSGQLLLKKHKRIKLDIERRLEYIFCYIHHNPIHHNFVRSYSDWTFSTYQKYINQDEKFVGFLDLFGGIENFLLMHDQFQMDKLNDGETIDLIG